MAMPRGFARIAFAVLLSTAAVAPACVSDHFSIERVGGSKTTSDAGPVTWCDVKKVLSQRCWRCHHNQPENGAPFELCNYADTQNPYAPGFSNLLVWQEMQDVVSKDFMPPVALFPDLVPPVQSLDATQKGTLLAWFDQGAPLGSGGAGGASAAVEPTCGGDVDALHALCLSGKVFADWNAGGAGGSGGAAGAGAGGGAGANAAAGAGGASAGAGGASSVAGAGGK